MKNVLAFVIFGLMVIAATACNTVAEPFADSLKPVQSDDSDLRPLMERMLGGPYVTETPIILPGQLPPAFDLPLPEGSKVIGSVVISADSGGTTHVILDVFGDSEEVFSSLIDALADKGWQSQDSFAGIPNSGFQSGPLASFSTTLLCSETEIGSLNLSAFPIGDGLTGLRYILINNVGQAHCGVEQVTRVELDRGETPLPSLTTPPGIRRSGGRSGKGTDSSGMGDFYSEADLEGTISVEEVETHYREQLIGAGWSLLDQDTAGISAWSTWRFADNDERTWGGMLLVIRVPYEEDKLFAYLRATQGGPGSGGNGSTIELLGPLR